eukprot:TRINITY_DN111162_c0_g1_i1.p1 TRINITY_DN111162_c0_g1~~TRINITY_DN111162_c0_g1_i1.p1  ORF type:complete len:463 (+),score=46.34 TRINITY_DN111162_c0_g1_i1:115-1503(+)
MGQNNGKPMVHMTRDYDYSVHPATQWQWHKQELAEKAMHTEEDVTGSYFNGWERFKSNFDFDLLSPASPIASTVVSQARWMANSVVPHEPFDMLHSDWDGPNGQGVLAALFQRDNLDDLSKDVLMLIAEVQSLSQQDPILNESQLPAKIYGDIHGQFRDMLLLLHDFGFPHSHGQSFIFNGDWVDRGKHQVEVLCLVFALKAAYPHNVKLNRGNHEDAVMNQGPRNFKVDCETKFGASKGGEIFQAFARAFEWLPLGTVVDKRVLVVHGGVGDGDWDLEHLTHVQRPLGNDMLSKDKIVYNLMWSDPVPETQIDSFGVHGSPRDNHQKLICRFGADVTKKFLERNGLDMLIRSHEAKVGGCGYEVMHGGKCVVVFSARDYENHHNDACVLSLRRQNPYVVSQGVILVRPQVLRSITKPDEPEHSYWSNICGLSPGDESGTSDQEVIVVKSDGESGSSDSGRE